MKIIQEHTPTVTHEENAGFLALVNSTQTLAPTRHLSRRICFIPDIIAQQTIQVIQLSTNNMLQIR